MPLSHGEEDDIEEERRLFYVGLTRAIEKLTLSYSNMRRRYGASSIFSLKSSFLDDIPDELIVAKSKNKKKRTKKIVM